jgi:hypothetical protein
MDRPDVFVRIEIQDDVDMRSASEAERSVKSFGDDDRELGDALGQCLTGIRDGVARMALVIAKAIDWLEEDTACGTDDEERVLWDAARKVIEHYDAIDAVLKTDKATALQNAPQMHKPDHAQSIARTTP